MGIEFPSSVRAGDSVVTIRTADNVKGKKAENLNRMLADGDLNDNITELAGKDGQLDGSDLVNAGFDPNQSEALAAKLNGTGSRSGAPSLVRELGGRNAVSLDEVVRSRPSMDRGGLNALPAKLTAIADPMQRDAVIMELATDASALSLRADTLGGASETTRSCWRGLGLPQNADQSGVRTGGQEQSDFATIPSAKAIGDWCKKNHVSKDDFAQAVISHPDIPINARRELLHNLGVTDGDAQINAKHTADVGEIQKRAAALAATLGASTPCQTLTMATGNGTGTAGIAGRRNVGAGYFQTPQIAPTAQRVFTPEDATKPVVMRFNAVGVDENMGVGKNDRLGSNAMTMRVGNQTIHFDVLKNAQGGNDVIPSDPSELRNNPLVTYHPETNSLTIAAGAGPIAFEQRSIFVLPEHANEAPADADEFQVSVTTYNASSVTVDPPRVSLPLEDTFDPDRFTTPDFSASPAIKDMAKYLQQFPVSKVALSLTGVGPVNVVDGKRVPTKTETSTYGDGAESRTSLKGARHADVNGTVSEDRQTLTFSVTASTDHVRSSLFGTIGKATGPQAKAAQERLAVLQKENPGMSANQLLSALRSIAIEHAVQKQLHKQGVVTSAWPEPAAVMGNSQISMADYTLFNQIVP
ncbi:MAG: hypothetical protein H7338_24410 [Candidatus Sericytochromatia bacterium]|nr:hypothetical protein [Candidatus Sericytochromatia bacterium]